MTLLDDAAGRPAETAAELRAFRSGRLLVGAAILLSAFTLRLAVTSFSPLAEQITHDVGLSRTFIGVFGTLPAAMFAASGLVAPRLMSRLGLERTVLVAMLVTGAGLLARAVAPGGWPLLVLSAVALGGMGITNIALPPLVKRYFPDRIALVSAVYVTLLQLGTVLPAMVAVPIADAANWRVSLGIWSIFGFIAAVPWLVVAAHRRGRDVHDQVGLPPSDGRAGSVWRTPLGWAMAVLFGGTSLITYSLFAWMPSILTSAGGGKAFAGTMVGLLPFVGLAPSLLAPMVVAKMRNQFPLIVACVLCYAVGLVGLYTAPMAVPLLWVVLIGLGMSTFPVTLVLINVRSRTQTGSAALSNFTQGVGYVLSCVGPVLFGVLHTATGGWGVPMVMLGVAAAGVAIGGWVACRPCHVEDVWLR